MKDDALKVDLSGHVGLVTGASRNIGRAIATVLAASGVNVACIARSDADALHDVCEEIGRLGGKASPFLADLRDIQSLRELGVAIRRDLGAVDILVHNAAMRPRRRIDEVTVEEWDDVFATNLRGSFFLSQIMIPDMRAKAWGRIIHVGGLDAYWGNPQRPHVVATKLGTVGLARALANETARWGITVNTVVPGVIETERLQVDWYGGSITDMYADRLMQIPQGRLGRPEDVANACLYFASDEASYVTGQELIVAGGAPLLRQRAQEYE
jgi:NAD(P)-dependent dehydrogenase (short-subunit alcohol dehydrogenase family)